MIKYKFEELFGIDLRSLALMRIGFSLIVIGDLIHRSHFLSAFYTDAGVLPREYALKLIAQYSICVHMMGGSIGFETALFILLGLCASCVLVGYLTGPFTILTWFLLQSMHARNPLINNSGDALLHVIFFWCIFLPWGACWSVDRLRQEPKNYPARVFSMASFAYLLQIAFFYAFAGINKMVRDYSDWWEHGTAIFYAIHMFKGTTPWGHFLLQHPVLLKFLTLGVCRFECWGPLLLFSPLATGYLRLIVLSAFVFFHLGISLTFRTGYFQWIALTSLLGFLPTHFLDKIFHSTQAQPISGKITASQSHHFHLPAYVRLFLAALIIYVFLININQLSKPPFFKIPKQFQWVQHTLGMDIKLNMFAPVTKTTGWLVVSARLLDGSVVDILGRKSVSLDYSWRQYFSNLHLKPYALYRLPFARYVCRGWNSTHPVEQQVSSFDLIYMVEQVLPENQESGPHQDRLFSYYCAPG